MNDTGIAIRLALKTRRVPFEILCSCRNNKEQLRYIYIYRFVDKIKQSVNTGIVGCGRRVIAVVVRLGLSLGSSLTFLGRRAVIRRRITVIIIIIRGGCSWKVFVFNVVVVIATIHM